MTEKNNKSEVTCPLCNKKFKAITKGHIEKTHNINFADFKKLFPNLQMVSQIVLEKCKIASTKGANKVWENRRNNPEQMKKYKEKVSGKNNVMNWSNHQHLRDAASERMKKNWNNKEFVDKLKAASQSESAIKNRLDTYLKNKRYTMMNTNIEIIVKNQLDKLNIKYIQQYIVRDITTKRFKIPDFYLPDMNIIIECYGDYWHANPKKYEENYYHEIIKLAAKEIWDKDDMAINLYKSLGYKCITIWESEILSDNFDILSYIRNLGEILIK